MRISKILVLSAMASLVVYLLVTYLVKIPSQPQAANARLFVPILVALAVVDVPIGVWMERRALRGTGGSAAAANPEMRLRQAVVISFSFGLGPAIYGLVIWFLTSSRTWFWPLWAISAAYLVLLYGRLEDLQRTAEAAAEKQDSPQP